MLLREYFAAQAMAGILANGFPEWRPEDTAAYAVRHADALLAALEKEAPRD